jgi:ubiquinone/menaquinone biosynthesis C-methylase UbiE
MISFNSDEKRILWTILACPQCLQLLEETEKGAFCPTCKTHFPTTKNGQLDLRLKSNKKVIAPFTLTPSLTINDEKFDILLENPNKEVDFGILDGITKELATYIPKANSCSNLMLDLGCGETKQKPHFTKAGFKYVGLDYTSNQATLLGDAHALPFKNACFDFVFSRSVIEHLQYPFLALNEVYRVMKPNSKLIGSAAFLEPFHGNSFYHSTHLGLLNCFENAGFTVEHISPQPAWDVLTAQASMSLFPKMPYILSRALVAPLRSLHRIWWKIGAQMNPESTELKRMLWTAGSFDFVVLKS